MENERFLLLTDTQTLESLFTKILRKELDSKGNPDFEKNKITKVQAAKLAGCTIPTLDKLVKKGKFKEYSLGRRKYFLRSEIVDSLTK